MTRGTRLAAVRETVVETGEWEGVKGRLEDALILYEVFVKQEYRGLELQPGDVVLDLGAHIGAFAAYAERVGAKVIAVEPLPSNLELLRQNARCLAIYEAAVANEGGLKVDLYVPRFKHSATIVPERAVKRPKQLISVPTVSLRELTELWRPTKVKFDIEAAEYQALQDATDLGDSVEALAIELHVNTSHLLEEAYQLCGRLEDAGWKMVNKPFAIKVPVGFGFVRTWRR